MTCNLFHYLKLVYKLQNAIQRPEKYNLQTRISIIFRLENIIIWKLSSCCW